MYLNILLINYFIKLINDCSCPEIRNRNDKLLKLLHENIYIYINKDIHLWENEYTYIW